MAEHVKQNSGQAPVSSRKLKTVHRCLYCGEVVRRDDMTEEAMITGIIECPGCNRSGPLSLAVVNS